MSNVKVMFLIIDRILYLPIKNMIFFLCFQDALLLASILLSTSLPWPFFPQRASPCGSLATPAQDRDLQPWGGGRGQAGGPGAGRWGSGCLEVPTVWGTPCSWVLLRLAPYFKMHWRLVCYAGKKNYNIYIKVINIIQVVLNPVTMANQNGVLLYRQREWGGEEDRSDEVREVPRFTDLVIK